MILINIVVKLYDSRRHQGKNWRVKKMMKSFIDQLMMMK